MLFQKTNINIPADVPHKAEKTYQQNYAAITKKSGKLMLFACDQKIEHLNNDFYGFGIHDDAQYLEHIFNIASHGIIGAFATHLGLIARYAKHFPGLAYIAKLNGKTDLIPTTQRDPISTQLWSVHDVVELQRDAGISIHGVGYTIYLGSEHEHEMLHQAARMIHEAHHHGLLAILWIYPRGKSITDDQDPQLLAGTAGLAASLGADFVKIKTPKASGDKTSAQWLQIICAAAGNTKVICAGGEQQEPETFLQELYDQLHIGGVAGCATGRNIFQRSFEQAVAMTKAISALVIQHKDVPYALRVYKEGHKH